MKRLQSLLRDEGFLSVSLIVAISAVAYLPFVGRMTYYGDDWHIAWGGHTFGYDKVANIYSTDRPFMGIVYAINYLMLGDPPLHWQLYAVLQRTIGGLVFLWIARMLWPRQKRATRLMAVLFAVYPGFLLMPNASTYQTLLFGINLGLLSIGCSLRLCLSHSRPERIVMAVLSGVLAMGTVFMFEWFIGLEVLRLSLIGYVLGRQQKLRLWSKVRAVGLRWLPAATGVELFLFWRILFFTNKRHATSIGVVARKYSENLPQMLLRVPVETARSFGETLFSAWLAPLYNLTQATQNYIQLVVILFVGAISVALLLAGQYWLGRTTEPPAEVPSESDRWEIPAMLIGAINVFTALLLVVILDRGVSLNGNTYDRYTLTSIPGVAFMLVGALWLVIHSPRGQAGAIAVLAGLAVMTHTANAIQYSEAAAFQRQFWWQLAWRAPGIRPGTVLMPSLQPYDFVADYDIFPEANLIFWPNKKVVEIGADVLNRDTALLAISGAYDIRYMRTIVYPRDFRNLLVATYGYSTGQGTCMHLLDNHAIELSFNEKPFVAEVAPYSNISQVDPGAPVHTPPEVFFGPEPPHTWCYYYEKISLARQTGDWPEAARLGDEAASRGYQPSDLIEWMPLLEAYANVGRTQDVQRIASIIRSDKAIGELLCLRFGANAAPPGTYRSPEAFRLIATELCQ